MDKIKFIIDNFKASGIEITDEQANKYYKLYEFLVEYNQNVNLTAITEFSDVIVKHFVDSVLPFTMIDAKDGASFIDVGTGAGFPSIPLMIYRNDLKGTLLEALNKRCVFLEKACEIVGVKATIVHGRAEDYAKEKRGQFDIATARAVAAMPVLSEYCMPYVKKGGMFVALKSVNEEITDSENAIKVLGGKLTKQTDYSIANGDNRRLFVIEKISDTPTKYPRNPSMIKKKPL
ncbi:MAG: 16S rRNA (guanine(527)-N(7))-methyltransferase RsmG [Ruminococcaceae bacterium]|nr:16S rRNA (guanine(527)-N(7))-methyltransferase RsmG [Oscillospiraceae bacterium]